MRRTLIFFVLLVTFSCREACYGENSQECSRGCARTGHHMKSFDYNNGCICEGV